MDSDNMNGKKKPALPARKELKKAVEAVHSSSKLGFLALKLLNVMVHNALRDIDTNETYRIAIGAACVGCGFNSNDTKVIKTAAKELQREQIEWDVTGHNSVWGVTSFLSEVIIRDGVIEYSMPPTVRKMFSLKEGRSWALLNLEFQTKFTSVFALKMYENTARYKKLGKTGKKSVAEWRKLLQAHADIYDEFKYFKRDVIEKAIREVNDLTDITLTAEYIKEGRPIVAINIFIEPKKVIIEDAAIDSDILKRIMDLGISEKVAKKHIADYDYEYLLGNLEVVEEKYRSGGIKSSASAFFASALETDYRPIKTQLDKQKEVDQQRAAEAEAQIAEMERQEREAANKRTTETKTRYESLTNEEQDHEIAEFSEYLRVGNKFLYSHLQKNGIMSTMVFNDFILWLANKWGLKKS